MMIVLVCTLGLRAGQHVGGGSPRASCGWCLWRTFFRSPIDLRPLGDASRAAFVLDIVFSSAVSLSSSSSSGVSIGKGEA